MFLYLLLFFFFFWERSVLVLSIYEKRWITYHILLIIDFYFLFRIIPELFIYFYFFNKKNMCKFLCRTLPTWLNFNAGVELAYYYCLNNAGVEVAYFCCWVWGSLLTKVRESRWGMVIYLYQKQSAGGHIICYLKENLLCFSCFCFKTDKIGWCKTKGATF